MKNKIIIPKSVLDVTQISDTLHPLAGLTSISPQNAGIEDDIKRKGVMSDIIKRLARLEEDVRKIKAGG